MTTDSRINYLENNINKNIVNQNEELNRFIITKTKFSEIRDIFKCNFSLIVDDLNLVIEKLTSSSTENKIEEKDDESPASIKRCLNLNWIPRNGATEENLVSNTNQSGSYWCVKSEEILDGAFICKILIEHIGNTPDWHHQAGVTIFDKDTSGQHYMDGCLFLSSGIFQVPFEGANSSTVYPQKWKTGDEILIKRDTDGYLWFGLNNEFDMVKHDKVEGNVRITMGFLNMNTTASEKFRMTNLEILH